MTKGNRDGNLDSEFAQHWLHTAQTAAGRRFLLRDRMIRGWWFPIGISRTCADLLKQVPAADPSGGDAAASPVAQCGAWLPRSHPPCRRIRGANDTSLCAKGRPETGSSWYRRDRLPSRLREAQTQLSSWCLAGQEHVESYRLPITARIMTLHFSQTNGPTKTTRLILQLLPRVWRKPNNCRAMFHKPSEDATGRKETFAGRRPESQRRRDA